MLEKFTQTASFFSTLYPTIVPTFPTCYGYHRFIMKIKLVCASKRIDKEGDNHQDQKTLVNYDYDSPWKHCGSSTIGP